jgi:16S rRNA G966 N2-methylase RsmD
MEGKNKLHFGDNLKILREYVPDASVDLIYLDPPFNSSATYNVLFKEKAAKNPPRHPRSGSGRAFVYCYQSAALIVTG